MDPDEAVHYEPPHHGLHCLPSHHESSHYYMIKLFCIFAGTDFLSPFWVLLGFTGFAVCSIQNKKCLI